MPSPSIVLLRTQSDARLVSLAREGHERAFEAIVERYRRQLLRSCRRVLPEARAEDALQQALVAAWRGLERGDEVRDLRPWLHRIAHNTSLNLLRQSGYDYDELQESLRIADATEDELERRAVVRQTLQGLAALPERQREALLAIAVEGRSQDEVASELGLTAGAVRQLVHRARTALRTAATAVVPLPVVSWVAAAGPRGDLAGRIAELSAGAGVGASAALAKAGTVAVLAGGAVVGPALVEKRGGGRAGSRRRRRRCDARRRAPGGGDADPGHDGGPHARGRAAGRHAPVRAAARARAPRSRRHHHPADHHPPRRAGRRRPLGRRRFVRRRPRALGRGRREPQRPVQRVRRRRRRARNRWHERLRHGGLGRRARRPLRQQPAQRLLGLGLRLGGGRGRRRRRARHARALAGPVHGRRRRAGVRQQRPGLGRRRSARRRLIRDPA